MEVVTQKYFLERMGIIKRAEILEKNMTSSQKDYISMTRVENTYTVMALTLI